MVTYKKKIERGVYNMELLEVRSISKTYGSGETAVQALKKLVSRFLKENILLLSVNLGPEKAHCLI